MDMTNLEKLKSVVAIQVSDGNWDANEYMRGMANGLILAEAIMENRSPEYKNPPTKEIIHEERS